VKVRKDAAVPVSSQPVQSVSARDIELSGIQNTSDVLKQQSPALNH
jgi:hypothetical protein